MRLTWHPDPETRGWRLDDESGAMVATLAKNQRRPWGSPWTARVARHMCPEGTLPPMFTDRHPDKARRALESCLARRWFGGEDVEFILNEEESK